MRKSVRSAVVDTAQRLHDAALLGETALREFKILASAQPKSLSPHQIRQIRRSHHLSQVVFARLLNADVSTLQKWEAGTKFPSGPSLKLLHIVKSRGLQALLP
jgi:putative transcriptional regulator